ncbi:aldehyde dehydrogenase (NADP(+)) [Deinococcus deserti]|uniref:2,5-dioxovalerate dehydrogenase n=1 Tax=Deinococcus deserti (strain DSM 17065 / CIP 109153 / LMG 22923 / VCD115) TaxID=546414 RepID=C1D1Y7_DEIDV|nr:aldehyde dehydrogenase (NADP(+)) [Deinococcus deserti]ACO47426.1 putative aldehyde dehydrogenase (NADP(+)) [Deinococcus deserti VCD115]
MSMPRTFQAVNPATGKPLPGRFPVTSLEELHQAVELAQQAALPYGRLPGQRRAEFLSAAADQVVIHGDELVARAGEETALPEVRLRGELARTANQLRLFADLVREGSWVDARLDRPNPARVPAKPDVRSLRVPLGPVAVFGASNFPLAFSVAGGDTASALAAGCPVVAKAHPAHPATSEVAARALKRAAEQTGMPPGVFSVIYDDGFEIGLALVRHPSIRAVGFTGSRGGGLALMAAAQARPVPIPVFAEMSSVNPVVLSEAALEVGGTALVTGLTASISGSGGQLCTQPGLLFVPEGQAGDALLEEVAGRLREGPACTLLSAGIRDAYVAGTTALAGHPEVMTLQRATGEDADIHSQLYSVPLAALSASPELAHEVFGPVSLAVRYSTHSELPGVLRELEGQLTATLHALPSELPAWQDVLDVMREKAGRLILNGFPTGVEVGHAMVHGGPFPATSDGASTSVGTRAIERFSRLCAYQDFPDSLLPAELHSANPLGIWRLVDGVRTKEELATPEVTS